MDIFDNAGFDPDNPDAGRVLATSTTTKGV